MTNLVNNVLLDLEEITVAKASICIPEECARYLKKSNKCITILHINIRSINKNFDELLTLLSIIKVPCDILILTECWLSKIANLPVLDGYNSYYTKQAKNQNEGVALYIKNHIECTVNEPVFTNGNCLTCQINNKLAIIAMYRSPSYKTKVEFDCFLDSLDSVFSSFSNFKSIFLIGDTNIDIKPSNQDERCANYLTLNATHGLLPGHYYPTRINNCIDHVLLKSNRPTNVLVLQSNITDHLPLLDEKDDTELEKQSAPSYKITKIQDCNVLKDIECQDFSHVTNTDDPDIAATNLVRTIQSIINKHTKIVKVPKKERNLKRWITPGLLRCIRNRDRLHQKARNVPSNDILQITYRRYRNFCNGLLRKLKIAHEKLELEIAKHNPKTLWNKIKEITNTKKISAPPLELLKSHPNPYTAASEVCKFFATIGTNLASKFISTTQPVTPLKTSPLNSFVLLAVDDDEVESTIMNLRSDSATGWDGISPILLKLCRKTIVPLITHVINISIANGIFPKPFKKALVHPIYKSGSRDCSNNYRPISVLSAMSKVMERLINGRLLNFLEKNKIIAPNQYGFKKGVSAEDAITDLTELVARKLDDHKSCLAIFLDLTKAFDTVSVPTLLSKMEILGIRGKTLDLFKSYLQHRRLSVKIDTCISGEEIISYGVPQGSVLGPTLFLVYINDLCTLPLLNSYIFTYADDTAIVVCGDTWADVKYHSQRSLQVVMSWLQLNLLSLNLSKTNFIPFCVSHRTKAPPEFTITAHSCDDSSSCSCLTISRAGHTKYLGVVIDDGLKWYNHVDNLVSKVRKLIYIFKSLRQCADSITLKMVYQGLCESVIGYCIPVWGGTGKTKLLGLERAQRAVLKVMLGKPFRFPTTQLYADCKVLTVRQLFVLRATLWKHSRIPLPDPNKRSFITSCPSIPHKTSFVSRQLYVVSSLIYRKISTKIQLNKLNRYEAKAKLKNWLYDLDYTKTEELLIYPR